MARVLLLTQSYEPLRTITVRDAIVKMVLGKAEVVEVYQDREIRSARLVLKAPAVMRLLCRFKRHKHQVKFCKTNLLARDRWRCQYCGTPGGPQHLTMDHVLPKAQGGDTCWENIVMACQDCNARKANRTPEQASMTLRSYPARPTWVPLFSIRIDAESMPEAWHAYLAWYCR